MVKSEQYMDWLFHYNPYKQKMYAFKREHLSKYFDGTLTAKDMVIGDNFVSLTKKLDQRITK